MTILNRQEVLDRIQPRELINAMGKAFSAYSEGKTVSPPVSSLRFSEQEAEVHVKSAAIEDGEYFVVKVASNYPGNKDQGLSSCQGMMTLYEKSTGRPAVVLQEEGCLTTLRTAAAAAFAVERLAPPEVRRIGIVGTGALAQEVARFLPEVASCSQLLVWGRNLEAAKRISGAEPIAELEELVRGCQVIVTTTAAREPLIDSLWVQPGTLLVAIGADDLGKQELDPAIFARADHVIVDSRTQCLHHGEVSHAKTLGPCIELGELATGLQVSGDSITVVDLTGLAVQDLFAACLVVFNSLD